MTTLSKCASGSGPRAD